MEATLNDEKFANAASQEAKKSNMQMQHGCVAVRSGKMIAKGCNSYRTYSKDGMMSGCCSCHAEIDVLRKCMKQSIFNRINIYIVRVSNKNKYMDSTPCVSCYHKMKNLFSIKYIIYSTRNGLIKKNFVDFVGSHITSGKKAIMDNRVKLL
jgi:deoxycytidylate deaminase